MIFASLSVRINGGASQIRFRPLSSSVKSTRAPDRPKKKIRLKLYCEEAGAIRRKEEGPTWPLILNDPVSGEKSASMISSQRSPGG